MSTLLVPAAEARFNHRGKELFRNTISGPPTSRLRAFSQRVGNERHDRPFHQLERDWNGPTDVHFLVVMRQLDIKTGASQSD